MCTCSTGTGFCLLSWYCIVDFLDKVYIGSSAECYDGRSPEIRRYKLQWSSNIHRYTSSSTYTLSPSQCTHSKHIHCACLLHLTVQHSSYNDCYKLNFSYLCNIKVNWDLILRPQNLKILKKTDSIYNFLCSQICSQKIHYKNIIIIWVTYTYQ